ncbi:MAG: hypothetical protein HYZ75_04060 [Elusimicrobia bacterium]|nr:hypothetical protein [Elusimicrobiota bacterium]
MKKLILGRMVLAAATLLLTGLAHAYEGYGSTPTVHGSTPTIAGSKSALTETERQAIVQEALQTRLRPMLAALIGNEREDLVNYEERVWREMLGNLPDSRLLAINRGMRKGSPVDFGSALPPGLRLRLQTTLTSGLDLRGAPDMSLEQWQHTMNERMVGAGSPRATSGGGGGGAPSPRRLEGSQTAVGGVLGRIDVSWAGL